LDDLDMTSVARVSLAIVTFHTVLKNPKSSTFYFWIFSDSTLNFIWLGHFDVHLPVSVVLMCVFPIHLSVL